MRAKNSSIKTLLLTLLIALCSSLPSAASSQTVSLTATPNFGAPIVSGFLESYKIETAALSATQTAVTPEDSFVYYTWSLDLESNLPCPQASLQNVHIRATNDSTTEGDPDWSQIGLYTNDGDITTILDTIQQPVTEGTSASGVPFISRNNGSLFGVYDIGINGGMEGTWDLSTYNIDNPIGIVVTHDAEDGTVGLQTTLESIQLTYDTTECDVEVVPPTNNQPTTPPAAPKTGIVINLVVLLAALGASILLLVRTAKHFKAKH